MQLDEVNTPEMKNTFELRKLKAKVDELEASNKQMRMQLAALNEVVKKLITKLGPQK